MKYDLDGSTVHLRADKLISLPDAKGSIVAVLWGSVWLTQDGDSRDYELNAGDSRTIHGEGTVVVSAFENSAVSILHSCERASDSVRYVTREELRQFERDAHVLRALNMASLIYKVGSAVSRALTKLREHVVALWINNVRDEPAGPRHGLRW
jgi:Protein of unknown function (DUF2917)